MPRLLVTGTMSRRDILEMFTVSRARAELIFVEYERGWGDGVDPRLYQDFGDLVTWEAYSSANKLLDQTGPDRLVFLFTNSLNQVALRVAARHRGIESIHAEHGYRPPIAAEINRYATAHTREGAHYSSFRTHSFFARSLVRSGRSAGALAKYASAVRREGASPAVLRSFADLRRVDRYVSFSAECFDHHRDVDLLPAALSESVVFTGIPQFDDFRITSTSEPERSILLIDHQLHNARIFGWDERFRRAWVERLVSVAKRAGFKLFVKLHPGDRSDSWRNCWGDPGVQIVQREDLGTLARRVSVVLGTCSTLQLPFAALPHVAMITLEIHPEPDVFASRRFVEAGVAEPVRDFSELLVALEKSDELRVSQEPFKAAFTKRFLERLDGRAGERLAAALTR